MEFTIGDKGKNAKLSRIKETASTFAQAPHGRFRHKIDGKFGKNSLKGTGQTGLTKITNNITNINVKSSLWVWLKFIISYSAYTSLASVYCVAPGGRFFYLKVVLSNRNIAR